VRAGEHLDTVHDYSQGVPLMQGLRTSGFLVYQELTAV